MGVSVGGGAVPVNEGALRCVHGNDALKRAGSLLLFVSLCFPRMKTQIKEEDGCVFSLELKYQFLFCLILRSSASSSAQDVVAAAVKKLL